MLTLEEVRPGSAPALEVVRELFERLDQAGVRYCHFKSNAFLDDGLAGRADLDVLVDRRQAGRVADAVAGAGFRRFRSAFLTSYPGVEDHLGLDPATGTLVHLHLHYRLVVGARNLKGHELQCADALLEARVVAPDSGVFTSSPAYELFLLLVRSALKITLRDLVLGLLGRPAIRGRTRQELEWLRARTGPEEVRAIVERELGPGAAARVPALLARVPSAQALLAFRLSARDALAWCRRQSAPEAAAVQLSARAVGLLARLDRRLLHQPRPFRRTPHAGGLSIAFLGTHGAGKSTVTAEIVRWLGWKADVYPVYFGSGAGTSSLLRRPMKVVADWGPLRRLRRRQKEAAAAPAAASSDAAGRGWLPLARAVWALALALEKRSKLRRSLRARRRGMIVICDRYPQVEVLGYNDAPLLGAWLTSPSPLRRTLARFEYRIYERAVRMTPDLVIKLDVPPEVAAGRRPEETVDELRRRREAVRRMRYGERCHYVEIDASAPVGEVLLAVKRAIWERL
ncbi:MAG TPA: hypothetical protein VFZ01_18945 [Geminicoccaceae bacterium]